MANHPKSELSKNPNNLAWADNLWTTSKSSNKPAIMTIRVSSSNSNS